MDADGDGEISYNEFCSALHDDDLGNPEMFLQGRTDGVGDAFSRAGVYAQSSGMKW